MLFGTMLQSLISRMKYVIDGARSRKLFSPIVILLGVACGYNIGTTKIGNAQSDFER